MRKIQRKSFTELMKENMKEMLTDPTAMKVLEEKLELKWMANAKTEE